MSETYERIWRVVRRIPRGRVATYGQVAAIAGFATQPRLAGYALHALPHASDVPWHRVVAAGGRIALPDFDGAATVQRILLESEGVAFRGHHVDLAQAAWVPGTRVPRVKRDASRKRSARDPKPRRRRASGTGRRKAAVRRPPQNLAR